MIKINKTYNKILAAIFLSLTIGGMLLFLISKKKEINKIENRKLAILPKLDIKKLDPFPDKFETYFSDHFPFRNQIVKGVNKVNYNFLKISTLPNKVIIGSEGYLFTAEKQLATAQGKNLQSGEQLENMYQELLYRKEYCAKNGARFYFVIIPQKHSIYSKNIPLRFKNGTQYTLRMQLEDYLEKKNFPYIDPTDYLLEKKNLGLDLYFKTDNHWNLLGGFYGTQYITDKIRQDYPQVKPLILNNYEVSVKECSGKNLAQMLNLKNEIKDKDIELKPLFNSSASKGKKAGYHCPNNFPYPWDFEIVYKNPAANNLKILIHR